MRVAVIDYKSGNLSSAARGLQVAAAQQGLDVHVFVTDKPDDLKKADKIVLPGQGAFADCAHGLASVSGLKEALLERVDAGVPFLGICVGMQLMAERGLEHGLTPGLGWVKGEITKLPAGPVRLPHMGWNELRFEPGTHRLLMGLRPGDHAYFVHSYALSGSTPQEVIATTDYAGDVVAMVAKDNKVGTQFHVEKSQIVGLTILGNFLAWSP